MVTEEERRELFEAIAKVLPPEARRIAKTARRALEAKRKADAVAAFFFLEAKRNSIIADAKAAKKEQRKQELAEQERRQPEDDFDFIVAGVSYEGRHRLIARHLNVGDWVVLLQEPNNRRDNYAVAVILTNGKKIGYVPRERLRRRVGQHRYASLLCGHR